jgi:hypothetical protein
MMYPSQDPASGREIINLKIHIQDLQYTAPPLGGFPIPQITKPITANQSPQTIQLVNELKDYKVWVRPCQWAMKFVNDLHFPCLKFNKVMSDFLDREPDDPLSLIQPSTKSENETSSDGSPWYFLACSLSQKEHDLTVNTGIITSKQATLFITPYEQLIPKFVMMLMGISYDSGKIEAAQIAITEAFQKTLTTQP